MTLHRYFGILILGIPVLLSSCEKNLEVAAEKAENSISPENAIKTPADLQMLLNSCYDASANMMNGRFQIAGDLLTDDLQEPINADPFRTGIYKRRIDEFNSFVGDVYSQPYYSIYRCNVLDLYYDKVAGLSDADKQRIKGEASFLKAMCHWELLRLFAQPYGYTADNSHLGIIVRRRAQNEPLSRSTVAESYSYIISELNNAINLLPVSNGAYVNKHGARALLAKVYFQMGNYSESLPLLNEVINNGGYTLSDSLNRFKREETASEVVFGFTAGDNIYERSVRSAEFKDQYRSDLNKPNIGLSTDLYNHLNDSNDRRLGLIKIFDPGQPNQVVATTKFNQTLFAFPYITLTDLILTRAEAQALLGDASGATTDLTRIINRAYINPDKVLQNINPTNLIDNIRLQRRLELYFEGDRVHQLKRIGVSKGKDNLFVRGVPWNCNGMVLQFPSSAGTSRLFQFNPTATCN